ncbi:MAG: glyceraldehyde-3-phosphate dehydrogenase [Syntrophobacteraceae bacterium CG2_30_61_12]|nr:MAG: glyceraldehyde-3-phosphate dehydrogenase [Syntrophobacteraceae bacterium CG2_30_61_12]
MATKDKFVPMKLGINGLGRIAKLSIWHQVERQYFSELVVNIGREVGSGLEDIAHFIERDSSYGALNHYLYGCRAGRVIEEIDPTAGTMRINGVMVRFLTRERNPSAIGWRDQGVDLVVDATGAFLDPTLPPDAPKGSVRGHFAAGAKKVVVSAPFKIKDKTREIPPDAVTTVMGINDADYDPKVHNIISNASCTTTCLAYLVKPMLDYFGPQRILSASMTTVHAATSSQQVLDRSPKTGVKDLRKNRSVSNNIILTTTGAAKALSLVIPEMKRIGFIAESVRVPVTTGSLIILMLLIQDESFKEPINRDKINGIYRNAQQLYPESYLLYSEQQNVSSDIIGMPRAAAVIESHETHTRTAAVRFDLNHVLAICATLAGAGEADLGPTIDVNQAMRNAVPSGSDRNQRIIEIPVTQAVIYGWYDNELGSYTNMLGDRTVSIARLMQA